MLWCPNQQQTYVVGISMHNVVRSCWVACETFLIFYRPTDLINKYASGLCMSHYYKYTFCLGFNNHYAATVLDCYIDILY